MGNQFSHSFINWQLDFHKEMIDILVVLFASFVGLEVVIASFYIFRFIHKSLLLPLKEEKDKISIIIPFKNESKRIHELLTSFNNSVESDEFFEIILVNDGSIDDSKNVIESNLKRPFKILDNPHSGKKAALDFGIRNASYPFILTLDADVSFDQLYLQNITALKKHDLTVLPVNMTGESFIQHLGLIEFDWLQLLTFSSITTNLANGANLLFRKSVYLETYSQRKDLELESGDDVFLLGVVKDAGYSVARYNHDTFVVETQAPESIAEIQKQRARWMSKITKMKGSTYTFQAILLISLQVLTILSLLLLLSPIPALWLLIPLFTKMLTELGISLLIYPRKKIEWLTIAVFVHQILYPFLLLFRLLDFKKNKRNWR